MPIGPVGLVNFRDVAGAQTESGAVVQAGVLYRGDAPSPGDPSPAGVVRWPPTLVLDLRKHSTDSARHPLAAEGTRVCVIPLMEQDQDRWDVRAWEGRPSVEAQYLEYLRAAGSHIGNIFEMLSAAQGPTFVHCAAGKDRTGVLAAVLMRAAGITRHSILDDFLRSGPNMPRVLARLSLDYSVLDDQDRLRAEQFTEPSPAAITGVLDEIDSAPGGAAGWAVNRGASEACIDRWTSRLLDPSGPGSARSLAPGSEPAGLR